MTDFYLKNTAAHSVLLDKPVGHLQIVDNIYWGVRKKPCWWHRLWMRVLLGWKWHDGNVTGGERKNDKGRSNNRD